MADPKYFDVSSAAVFLGMTEKAIRGRIARRQVPFKKLGGRIVFSRAELERYLEKLDGPTAMEAIANLVEN